MMFKHIWQAGIASLLVAATVGTVALAAETGQRPVGLLGENVQAAQGALGFRLASDERPGERSRSDADWRRGDGNGGAWIPIERAIAAVTEAGYRDVREVERDRGRYEIEARDQDGRRWEVHVDGRTGEIVGRDHD